MRAELVEATEEVDRVSEVAAEAAVNPVATLAVPVGVPVAVPVAVPDRVPEAAEEPPICWRMALEKVPVIPVKLRSRRVSIAQRAGRGRTYVNRAEKA